MRRVKIAMELLITHHTVDSRESVTTSIPSAEARFIATRPSESISA
jgi:hypothetical protein